MTNSIETTQQLAENSWKFYLDKLSEMTYQQNALALSLLVSTLKKTLSQLDEEEKVTFAIGACDGLFANIKSLYHLSDFVNEDETKDDAEKVFDLHDLAIGGFIASTDTYYHDMLFLTGLMQTEIIRMIKFWSNECNKEEVNPLAFECLSEAKSLQAQVKMIHQLLFPDSEGMVEDVETEEQQEEES